MRRHHNRFCLFLPVCALPVYAALGLAAAQPVHAQAAFSVRQLDFTAIDGFNGVGQVIGRGANGNTFLYDSATDVSSDLGALGVAVAINDAGQIAGNRNNQPYLYDLSSGQLQNIRLGVVDNGVATGINQAGTVVGYGMDYSPIHFAPVTDAYIYRNGQRQRVTYSATTSSASQIYAFLGQGINSHDQVMGYERHENGLGSGSTTQSVFFAMLNGAGTYAVASRAPSYMYGGFSPTQRVFPTAINDDGTVVGYSTTNSGTMRAFAGSSLDLGTLGGNNSYAEAVDSFDAVVGRANLASGDLHAFVYRDGQMTDLNTQIPAGSNWTLAEASKINDRGQIVGYGLLGGQSHTFLLTPTSVSVSGTITLQGCVQPAQSIVFEFRPTDGSAVFTRLATLTDIGSFALTDVPANRYNLAIKGAKWLQKVVPLDATYGHVSGVTATLLAGDVTNHNAVTTADYLALKVAFGSQPGDPNWDPRADLNCDGTVSTADYLLLKANFGMQGDP